MEVKCFFNIVMQHKTFTIVPNGDQNQIAFATLDTEAYRDLYYFDLQSKIVSRGMLQPNGTSQTSSYVSKKVIF